MKYEIRNYHGMYMVVSSLGGIVIEQELAQDWPAAILLHCEMSGNV